MYQNKETLASYMDAHCKGIKIEIIDMVLESYWFLKDLIKTDAAYNLSECVDRLSTRFLM